MIYVRSLQSSKPMRPFLFRPLILRCAFSRAVRSADPAVQNAAAGDVSVADVAQQMASSFTNASSFPIADYAPICTQPVLPASSLPNPFLTRAIGSFGSIPLLTFNVGGGCENYVYQDDYSHGRVAAERRRLIFPLVHQAACEQGLRVGLFDALIMQETRSRKSNE